MQNDRTKKLADDAHEARGSYEERLHDVPVSDCPYCGCKRVVIHDFSDIYENPHSYRVEHVDEKEAFETGCFETYYAFDSAEKAVEHANMRDLLTDEPMDARRDSDGTCPDADGTASNAPEGDAVKELREFIDDQFVSGKAAWTQGMAISDMVERDYVRRETYDNERNLLLDKLVAADDAFSGMKAERDKLKAKASEKAARIDELERLYESQCFETACQSADYVAEQKRVTELEAERDELKRQLGTVSAPSGNLDAQARAEIEDMERSRAVSGDAATEVDAGTGGTEKTPQEPRECGRITFTDTREMLEADICSKLNDMARFSWRVDGIMKQAKGWLDRQADITRMEDECACHDCTIEQVEELQAKVDELEAEKRECMEDCANRVSAAILERDMYREKLGRAVDAAHEVVRIMEVER